LLLNIGEYIEEIVIVIEYRWRWWRGEFSRTDGDVPRSEGSCKYTGHCEEMLGLCLYLSSCWIPKVWVFLTL